VKSGQCLVYEKGRGTRRQAKLRNEGPSIVRDTDLDKLARLVAIESDDDRVADVTSVVSVPFTRGERREHEGRGVREEEDLGGILLSGEERRKIQVRATFATRQNRGKRPDNECGPRYRRSRSAADARRRQLDVLRRGILSGLRAPPGEPEARPRYG
jgi:hypothetical protein